MLHSENKWCIRMLATCAANAEMTCYLVRGTDRTSWLTKLSDINFNLNFSDDLREDRSELIPLYSFDITSKIWRWSLKKYCEKIRA